MSSGQATPERGGRSVAAPPCLDAGGGGGKKCPPIKKVVLPFAQYKLAYYILTAVETVLLTNSSLVHCIFVFSHSLKLQTFFFFGGGGGVM